MNIAEYETVEAELLALAKSIRDRKRPSYTVGDEDVLMNFKRDAKMSGITALQNWHTHFQKQVAAIARWVQTPDAEQSEPIEQRFADLINYCLLGYAAHRERAANGRGTLIAITPGPPPRFVSGSGECGVFVVPSLDDAKRRAVYEHAMSIPLGKYEDSDFHPV